LLSFGATGQAAGQFRLPQGLAVSPDGQYLYVIDTHNNRVQRFRMSFETETGGPNLSGGRKPNPLPMPQYVFELNQNRPNPFRKATDIRYQLPKQGKVSLNIYNINGQLVKTLVNQTQDAGLYLVKWDGRDLNNKIVASGVYVYRLQAGNLSDTRKIVLVK
jgi:DNA-binding beta-propeller fold protein YncE